MIVNDFVTHETVYITLQLHVPGAAHIVQDLESLKQHTATPRA